MTKLMIILIIKKILRFNNNKSNANIFNLKNIANFNNNKLIIILIITKLLKL